MHECLNFKMKMTAFYTFVFMFGECTLDVLQRVPIQKLMWMSELFIVLKDFWISYIWAEIIWWTLDRYLAQNHSSGYLDIW